MPQWCLHGRRLRHGVRCSTSWRNAAVKLVAMPPSASPMRSMGFLPPDRGDAATMQNDAGVVQRQAQAHTRIELGFNFHLPLMFLALRELGSRCPPLRRLA